MKIEISKIHVKNRFRKTIPDLSVLKKSIQEIGLLHPIVIDEKTNELIVGECRLEACKQLGWKKIPINLLLINPKDAEIDENEIRYDFLFREKLRIIAYKEPKLLIEAEKRMKTGKPTAKLAGGDVRDQMASLLKVSHGTYDKIKAIKEAVEKHLKEASDLPEKIDDGMSVDYAYQQLQREIEEKRPKPKLPKGEHDLIYIDIPWKYDVPLIGHPPYPTMTTEEVMKMKIPAHKDCVMFMWATNPKLADAFQVIKAWGFTFKSKFTWVKMKKGELQMTTGYYVRGADEMLLIAIKGNPGVPLERNRPPSVVFAERSEHSKKPHVFYEIIEKMYPRKTKIEMFGRGKARKGWKIWGDQAIE